MASLHRRTRSPFFWAAFTDGAGRRVFRSTKCASRPKAWEMALAWEKAAVLARRGHLPEVQARRVLDSILASVGEAPMNLVGVEEFFTGWLASKEAAKAAGTARRYRDALEPFVASLPPAKRRAPLTALTPREFREFRDGMLREGRANKTANHFVKIARACLSDARRQGLVTTNAAEAVEVLPDNSAERGTFAPAELRLLLAAADEQWRGAILAGYCCGLRLGDAVALSWENVVLGGPVPLLRFHPKKTAGGGAKKKPLEVPVPPDLEAWLLAAASKAGSNPRAPLFPALAKKKVTGRTGLSNTFSRLITAAGIDNEPVSEARGAKGRKVWRLSFHALRHTYVSTLANIGVAKEVRMKLAGHTSNAHDRYTHLETQTLAAAVRDFPSVL